MLVSLPPSTLPDCNRTLHNDQNYPTICNMVFRSSLPFYNRILVVRLSFLICILAQKKTVLPVSLSPFFTVQTKFLCSFPTPQSCPLCLHSFLPRGRRLTRPSESCESFIGGLITLVWRLPVCRAESGRERRRG